MKFERGFTMAYNYHEAVKDDIREYIKENYGSVTEKMRSIIFLDVLIEDSVTGDASGSYTMNRAIAKEYVIENIDLLKKVVDEYGFNKKDIGEQFLSEQWERFDVLIRLCLVREYFDDIFSEFLS